jgi:hypothetical protein
MDAIISKKLGRPFGDFCVAGKRMKTMGRRKRRWSPLWIRGSNVP